MYVTPVIRLILGAGMVLAAATALVAQDAEMTPEQQAVKCAAEGGCVTITLQALVDAVLAEKAISYQQGLRACNSNI